MSTGCTAELKLVWRPVLQCGASGIGIIIQQRKLHQTDLGRGSSPFLKKDAWPAFHTNHSQSPMHMYMYIHKTPVLHALYMYVQCLSQLTHTYTVWSTLHMHTMWCIMAGVLQSPVSTYHVSIPLLPLPFTSRVWEAAVREGYVTYMHTQALLHLTNSIPPTTITTEMWGVWLKLGDSVRS